MEGKDSAEAPVDDDDRSATHTSREERSDHDSPDHEVNPSGGSSAQDRDGLGTSRPLDGPLLHTGHDSPTPGGSARKPPDRSEDSEESSALAERSDEGTGSGAAQEVLEGEVLGAILAELSPERAGELTGIIVSLVHASESSWSAPLPEASDFYKYEPSDRERMMRWNDAGTSDESSRQSKLVDAQVEAAQAGPKRALGVVFVCLALAAVAGFAFDDTLLAALLLSPPILMFAQTLIAATRGR